MAIRSAGYGKQYVLAWPLDQLAMGNNVRWHGHVSSRDNGNELRNKLKFEVQCHSCQGRLKRKLSKQVEEVSKKVGLRRIHAHCRSKRSTVINQIANRLK